MAQQFNGRLRARERIAEDTLSFMVEVDGVIEFKAGQYAKITLKDKEIEDGEKSRFMSIASEPAETRLPMFATRTTGSKFKKYIENADEGTEVKLEAPLGNFTLEDGESPAVFISKGIGITPVRSVVEDADGKERSRRIVVVYSSESEEDAVFKDEIEEFSRKNENIEFHPLITDGLSGEKLKEVLGDDLGKASFYVSGAPKTVASIRKELSDLGVDKKRVFLESFSGY